MDSELRKKLHAIRERITKAFNACDSADKAIVGVQANLAAVQAGAGQSETIANAVPILEAMANAKILEYETIKSSYNTQFSDIVPE